MSYNKYKLCYKYVTQTRNLGLKYFDNLFVILFLKICVLLYIQCKTFCIQICLFLGHVYTGNDTPYSQQNFLFLIFCLYFLLKITGLCFT